LVRGLTTAGLGRPDLGKALAQHAAYRLALEECGLEVTVLDPDDGYPDSTFVEDTAVLTTECAIIMRPGAASRRGEVAWMEQTLRGFYDDVARIQEPGTADGGDIMMVGKHFYIGLSGRTSADGARQIIQILASHGMSGSTIPLQNLLHLKSAVAYLEDGNLVATGDLLGLSDFAGFSVVPVDEDERYAANCLWLNGTVLVASGYPKTRQAIEAHGYKTIALDVSEYRKLDGGLSCLSLRF
jgi:dimethylargininase